MHLDCYDLILNYAWINNQKAGSSGGRTYGPVVRPSVSTARTRSLKPPMPRPSVWPRIVTPAIWPGLCAFPRNRTPGLWDRLKEQSTELPPLGCQQFGYGHWLVGPTRHRLSLFVVLVGESSKARKGTSWNQIERLFAEPWVSTRITTGRLGATGLVHALRDQQPPTDRRYVGRKRWAKPTTAFPSGIHRLFLGTQARSSIPPNPVWRSALQGRSPCAPLRAMTPYLAQRFQYLSGVAFAEPLHCAYHATQSRRGRITCKLRRGCSPTSRAGQMSSGGLALAQFCSQP
jgi:hypothetical protein